MSLVLVCASIALLSLATTHIDSLELRSYDFLMSVLRGPVQPPDDIVIVGIDESSIKEYSSQFSWPWPRGVHAELIRRLDAAGARAIAFDVIFDLPSAAAEDTDLAAAIRASHAPVILGATTADVTDQQFHMTQQIRPLPAFIAAGARVGFVTIHPDVDGELRRAPLSIAGSPSFAAMVLDATHRPVNAAAVPVVTRGNDPEFLINYAGGARTIRTISYYQAMDLEHSLPSGFFKGKTVLVGRSESVQELTNRATAQDFFATPFDLLMPGIEIHANALETLAHGTFVRRASTSVNWAVLILTGALIAGLMLSGLPLRAKLLTAPALILLQPAVAAGAFVASGYWIYTVQPVLAGIGVFMLNALYQYGASEKERVFVRKALRGYVSKQVLQTLLENPSALDLGGVQLEATVLFSDIVGFSSISERLAPRELTALLNEYFTRMGDIIMASDGMIDKYIGDAIMAIWGAPLRTDRHAAKACAAALSMKRSIEAAGGPLRARIGLNTGSMMAGNLGHQERMDYTVIGDAVNLASRLEGANKAYSSSILVSQSTMAAAGEAFIFRRLDRIRVMGKQEPVAIYELLSEATGDAAEMEKARSYSFSRIVDAYDRREWREATMAAARHSAAFPGKDPAVDVYLERCRHFEIEPPDTDWDGVYSLKSK